MIKSNNPTANNITLLWLFLLGSLFVPTTLVLAEPATPTQTIAEKPAEIEEDFTEDEDIIEVSDPLETMNRAIFNFNDKAYVYFLKPVAVGYRKVVPEKGRISINNFFSNLLSPIRIVNAALQLKGEDATNEFARLLINTTIGLGGFFDIAKQDFGIRIKSEDFGQTLGYYGVGNGPYLVLPLFGPSTLRDSVGQLVDSAALDPLNYIFDDETGRYLLAKWVDIETRLSLDKDTYEALTKNALDPYIFLRNAYIQLRAGAINK